MDVMVREAERLEVGAALPDTRKPCIRDFPAAREAEGLQIGAALPDTRKPRIRDFPAARDVEGLQVGATSSPSASRAATTSRMRG